MVIVCFNFNNYVCIMSILTLRIANFVHALQFFCTLSAIWRNLAMFGSAVLTWPQDLGVIRVQQDSPEALASKGRGSNLREGIVKDVKMYVIHLFI